MSRPHLVIFRDTFTPTATFGVISLVERDGDEVRLRRLTESVEPERDHNRKSTETRRGACIPAGKYTAVRVESPSHGDVFQYVNVPNRSLCQIHAANWSHQLRGCTAPGLTRAVIDDANPDTVDDRGVSSSKKALALIMAELVGHDTIDVTIIDAIPEPPRRAAA